jgi:hypothetical protein
LRHAGYFSFDSLAKFKTYLEEKESY